MTSRELVFRALEFDRPERAPRDLWSLPWVAEHRAEDLAAVLERWPSDFVGAGQLGPGDRARGTRARKGVWVDEWGCAFTAGEDGVIGEVKNPPLADWSALDSFQPPWEIIDRADFEAVNRAAGENMAGEAKFLKCGTSLRPFERIQFLRGSENVYIDLAYETAELRRLIEMVHEFYLRELDGWTATAADGLSFMDDWGSQKALLIHPDQWRRLFKPLYREYCDRMHAAGKKVFFHSDGHIQAIYGDLIEVGMDAVNSQLFCMDIEALARDCKGKVTFWGELDRQRLLPFGTPAEVRAAVARVRRALDDGRGGVIAQLEWGKHNPRENIEAALEAWDTPLDQLLAEA
jgi:hypothetical protein